LEIADDLEYEIGKAMPKGYFDYHVFEVMAKYADSWGLVDLNNVPNLDRVAFEWSLVFEAATELRDHLRKLDEAIRERLMRKGV